MTTNIGTMRCAAAAAIALFGCTANGFASNIYVDDGQAIYSYTPSGARTTFSSQPGTTALQMAFNGSGTLYAAARDSNAIYQYSSSGVQSLLAAVTDPYGLAINSAGDIFTGAGFGNTLEEFTPGGVETTIATGLGIQDLAFDSSGDLLDFDSSRNIYDIAANGTKTVYAASAPSGFGMAVDSAGDVFASDWTNDAIDEFTPGSGWSTFASFPTGQLPTGMTFDASGNLYVTEVMNGVSSCCVQSVYEFSPSGARTTFATGLYLPFAVAIQGGVGAATPEPGTLLMMAGGVLLLAIGRRKTYKA